jgi:hypothetical protein
MACDGLVNDLIRYASSTEAKGKLQLSSNPSLDTWAPECIPDPDDLFKYPSSAEAKGKLQLSSNQSLDTWAPECIPDLSLESH